MLAAQTCMSQLNGSYLSMVVHDWIPAHKELYREAHSQNNKTKINKRKFNLLRVWRFEYLSILKVSPLPIWTSTAQYVPLRSGCKLAPFLQTPDRLDALSSARQAAPSHLSFLTKPFLHMTLKTL